MASLEKVQIEIQHHLAELQHHFTKDCHLTFVMRHQSKPGCWMVITGDPDLKAVADTVLKQDGIDIKCGGYHEYAYSTR